MISERRNDGIWRKKQLIAISRGGSLFSFIGDNLITFQLNFIHQMLSQINFKDVFSNRWDSYHVYEPFCVGTLFFYEDVEMRFQECLESWEFHHINNILYNYKYMQYQCDMKKYTLGDDLSYVEQQKQQLILQRLRTIYEFYTKIIVNIGPGGDFGRISQESQLMTEGKLMIFFRQFGILDEKLHHQNQIYQQTILRQSQVEISKYTHKWWLKNSSQEQPLQEFKKLPFKMLHAEFLKISNHSKILIFDQFLLLINRVAQLMFSSYLNFDEKLYQFLGIDSNSYKLKMKQVHFPFNCKPTMLSPLNSIQKKRSESLSMNDYSILKQPENKSQSIVLSTEKTTETDGVQSKIKRRLPKKLSSIVRERGERKNSLINKIEEQIPEENSMKRSHSQISLNYYDYFEMQKNQQNFERKVFKKH